RPPCPLEPEIELGVRVANKVFVEEADAIEYVAPVEAAEYRPSLALVFERVPARSADREGAVMRGRVRALHVAVRLRDRRSADVVGVQPLGYLEASHQVVAWIAGVGAHDGDVAAASLLDGDVPGGWL